MERKILMIFSGAFNQSMIDILLPEREKIRKRDSRNKRCSTARERKRERSGETNNCVLFVSYYYNLII